MKLHGEFIKLKKVKHKCPKDGIHKRDKHGNIGSKGILLFGDKVIYVGKDCFYFKLSDEKGIKVYYSIIEGKARSLDFVEKSYEKQNRLYDDGYSKKAFKILPILLISYNIKCHGILMGNVQVPTRAWIEYYLGYPYRFTNVNGNSINGYKDFIKGTKGLASSKLGDVGYCTKDKRWYVLDCNINYEND